MELLTKEIETKLRANHKANKDGTKLESPSKNRARNGQKKKKK